MITRIVYTNEVNSGQPPMFTVVIPEGGDRYAKSFTALLEGRDGAIWCGTLNGLYRLERTDSRFELRPVDIGMPQGQNPEQHFILDLVEDRNGSLWIAAASGLYRRWPDRSPRATLRGCERITAGRGEPCRADVRRHVE